MNRSFLLFSFLLLCMAFDACRKSDTIDSADALISTSVPGDTLRFDTVFTQQGSVTQKILVYNLNKQTLKFSSISLGGGSQSAYQLNVNGRSGTSFSDVSLEGGDSLYLFVKVHIDPTDAAYPFLLQDSIRIQYNGNDRSIQLQAYGQNAVYLHQAAILQDTAWDNRLPIVLLEGLTIPSGKTLSIGKGTHIYVHGKNGVQVDGTVKAYGDTAESGRISFLTDRLDEGYRNLAGAWTGINFGAASTGNLFQNVTVRNAVNAFSDTMNTAVASATKLQLTGCIIQNNSGYGMLGRMGNWMVTNSLLANNGQNIGLYEGGRYSWTYNTIAGYSNAQVSHSNSCVYFQGNAADWDAAFTNCIVYGDNVSLTDEVLFADGFSWQHARIGFAYSLVKYSVLPSSVTLSHVIANDDPAFRETNNEKAVYDFRLQDISPAYSAGTPVSGIGYDLSGHVRNSLKPSMGCYESN